MTKYVYDFSEGNKDMKDLLGGKGANLAEMTIMGLPVPHGFTLTTQACLGYLGRGDWPEGLIDEAEEHLVRLEHTMGKTLGDPTDPLLVSIRSGAKFSMPGMMDTVLNLGLNEDSLKGLALQTGDDIRFANDTYRRFIQMFGKIVMNVPAEAFEHALDAAKAREGPNAQDTDLDADDLRRLIDEFLSIYEQHTGSPFPTDPRAQMRLATEAVFRSWNGKRAVDYRRQNKIADDLGTAVNVVAMVFGNRGDDSGTGVAFTRDPATGERVPYGDYLPNAQGEDVVAGIRNTLPLAELQRIDPVSYGELLQVMHTLEMHYRDMCDIEFTIEKGKLWILQTRIGKRTAFGEWVMAFDMLEEGLIADDEALLRVDANRLEELFKRVISSSATARAIARGLNASPGAATGKAVFSADEAEAWAHRGERVILVRRETTPDDYHGMIASQGILTSAGGTNSHAAVVARGEGIPAVCGADAIKIDLAGKSFSANGTRVREGDVITIDGFSGKVYVGRLPLEESVLEKARSGDETAREEMIWKAFERIMRRADEVRRLRVRANADTPEQAANARERGAEGIGLCRTEHMFLGEERVEAVRQMIFADTPAEEQEAYDKLLPLQREDFVGIFRAMSGLPVTVRLLDPPLHEFLPNQVELAVEVAVAEARGKSGGLDEKRALLRKVNELHETNPMLGLRGVRLGIVKPGLYAMQVQAIIDAACRVKAEGGDPQVEIMIPLVATKEELRQMREELEPVARRELDHERQWLDHLEWGTMIELPRAAVTAGEIAEVADFFSFGTNDLTQTAFGFSRDDIGKFVAMYEERKLVPANPFVTVDRPGVGRLMRIATEEGRAANPNLHLGICGEHGGDPASVVFCHEVGLDYVSCSPFRVETARLAAGQAAVGSLESASK